MNQIRLTILVHDAWRDRFTQVVERCRSAGLQVERELGSVGVITGCMDEGGVEVLRGVEGVSAVEPERSQRAYRGPD